MLRIITAATALTVLVACDSEGIDRATDTDPSSTSVALQDGENSTDSSAESTDTDNVTTTNDTDTDSETTTVADNNDSDGSDSGSNDSGTDSGSDISDESGSASSDGGQTDAIGDDEGSSSSDGGDAVIADDDSSSSDDVVVAAPVADDFATDTGNGNALRVSSLLSEGSEVLCTTLSNQDDFSNIFVGDFILHNNAWRTFRAPEGFEYEQCIYTNTNGALVGWNYDWGPGRTGVNGNPEPAGDFFVRSYPELIYGIKDEFRRSARKSVTGLPVRISEMPTFQIDYSYTSQQYGDPRPVTASNNPRFPNQTDETISEISGERNVAVESFFYQPDAAGQCSDEIGPQGIVQRAPTNHTFEVMVWLDAGAERLPAGPDDFVVDVNIRNQPYKVYTKDSDERYIAFVAQNPQTTGTIFMNDFIDWARANAHQVSSLFGARSDAVEIQDFWCMANILVGTEIFWGAGDMNIMDWTITQTQ